MAPPLLTLQDIILTHGGKPLLEGASLCVEPRERLCLVGRNGSGKSTLLKIAAGDIEADRGLRFIHPNATIRYLPQEPDLSAFETTLAYVEAGLAAGDESYRALYLLNALGLSGDEATSHLSGGEVRRAALARVLAPEPDILLLDEPTNHLDLPAIEWLENELKTLRSAIVVISHDRRFLSHLSKTTLWIDRGQTRHLNEGFSAFENWRDKVLEEEELNRHKLDRQIAMEEDWVRYGVSGRRKRNQGRLARLADLRAAKRDGQRANETIKLEAASAQVSSQIVIDAKKISKHFGDTPIVQELSVRIQRGDRVGIVGPNGAGKTTLIKLLTGELRPDQGHVKLGTTLEMATLDQRRASLIDGTSLMSALTGDAGEWVDINGVRKHVIGYMKDFLFAPEQARTPVERLSGGERGRLTLARAFALPSNMLVLDEPTNDLDLETLDVLQDMLADYAGTVLVVSHDRDFLDRVATSVIVAEGDGQWVEYAGGYSDMLAQRGYGFTPQASAQSKATERTTDVDVNNASQKISSTTKKRLSFKDKHALDTLPAKIDILRKRIQTLETAMADPALYTKSPDKFNETSQALSKAELELTACEEQWLELEMMREEMEG